MDKNYITTFVYALLGGYIFSLAHIPLPWTLGPLVTVVVLKVGLQKPVRWPMSVRNTALLVLGYVMGRPFTPETGHHILLQLPLMVVMTLTTVFLCLLGGYMIHRFTGIGLATSLLGSMPAGLTQMAFVCEEIKEADVAAVTLMQTLRVLSVVFIVPFLVLHGLADKVDPVNRIVADFSLNDLPILGLFAACISGAVLLARRAKMGNPYLLAPLVATAALVLGGVHAPALPPAVVAIAQVCVGIRMGMNIHVESLTAQKKVFAFNFLSIVLVICALLGIDYILSVYFQMDFVTAFISTAPGGMTEMGLTALMVHAELSTVIAFQIFRLLFVLLIAIPVIKWWLCRPNTARPCCAGMQSANDKK
jgi:membrane AbrB-like protein